MSLRDQMIGNREHPFFRPLWRRIAIVTLCALWLGVELVGGSGFWAALAFLILAYAVWSFFIAYEPPEDGTRG